MFDLSTVSSSDSNTGLRNCRLGSGHSTATLPKGVRRFTSAAARGSIKAVILLALSCAGGQTYPPGPVQISGTNGAVALTWTGTAGVRYQAQCATNLAGPWQPVDAPTTSFTAANLCSLPLAYYRVANLTNTPQFLANYAVNLADTMPPSAPSG